MSTLYSMVEQPDLESPVLIMVLKGWIDAGLGADGAAELLVEELEPRTIARFDADGNLLAVLDWEICTLGDPLADVGLLMVYWTEATDEHPMLLTAPTTVDGFLSRKEVLDRYQAASGRDLSQIDFYIAFGSLLPIAPPM